jgi:hypothetical protein
MMKAAFLMKLVGTTEVEDRTLGSVARDMTHDFIAPAE